MIREDFGSEEMSELRQRAQRDAVKTLNTASPAAEHEIARYAATALSLLKELQQKDEEIARLKGALAYYADESNWSRWVTNYGHKVDRPILGSKRAREALRGEEV